MNKKIFELLHRLNIEYTQIDHPAAFTMEEIEEYGITKHGHIPKNLVLRNVNGSRNMLVVVHGDKRADLRLIRSQLGTSKLSFGGDDRLQKYLNVEKGSVSPLGIVYDNENGLEVYFDSDLKAQETVGCHPNDNRATLFLKLRDLLKYVESTGHEIRFIEV